MNVKMVVSNAHKLLQDGGNRPQNDGTEKSNVCLSIRQINTRPRSTKLFMYNTVTVPNYTEEYCSKPVPMRPRSAKLGLRVYNDRRNIPHPLEGFMVWRLPHNFPPLVEDYLQATAQLNPDHLIADYKVKSTYKGDYLGTQQGKVPQDLTPKHTTSKPTPGKGLASSMQVSYTIPKQSSNLKGNTTRYGCSKGIVRAAHGIVPTLANSKPPLNASYQTWYKSEFTKSKKEVDNRKSRTADFQVKLPKIDTSEFLQLIAKREHA